MAIELKVPEIGESITEVEIGEWLKKTGEAVQKDDPLVTLESEKATVELPSPEAGTIGRTLKQMGDVAKVGVVIGYLEHNGKAAPATKSAEPAPAKTATPGPAESKSDQPAESRGPEAKPAAATSVERKTERRPDAQPPAPKPDASQSGPDSNRARRQPTEEVAAPVQARGEAGAAEMSTAPEREEEVVPMSRLRRTVAERLVAAQRNAALLTTFNEIDMTQVSALRKQYGEAFQRKHNVKLGFMSFFVKASIDALKQFPAVNAEIRGTDIVYHNYFDVGIAIGGGKGLVVPILRNAERMSFAELERSIGDFGQRARENRLKPDELQGGTFTISNGGVYGSLLSTPIVNPPQSGVLGMHAIQERPVAHQGAVVIRPMMYVALTYDHRIVDGREAVTFLKRVKEAIEDPARMLMEV
jgi:2-oxoglutarate dehydrogenase E2 component (dihydrolipoamide succinyltransferase)